VTAIAGVRNFAGHVETTQPEGGIEVAGSVQLSSWSLLFARGGYVVTRVARRLAHGLGSGRTELRTGQSLLRHYPSLTLGLELALFGVRPFVGVQGGLRFDPYEQSSRACS
jgi:hypothetical protein